MRTENGTDAGSESRSKIYFDYAEQQGGKDREAGLKRKGENGKQSDYPDPILSGKTNNITNIYYEEKSVQSVIACHCILVSVHRACTGN